jgi:hypothetical protein
MWHNRCLHEGDERKAKIRLLIARILENTSSILMIRMTALKNLSASATATAAATKPTPNPNPNLSHHAKRTRCQFRLLVPVR